MKHTLYSLILILVFPLCTNAKNAQIAIIIDDIGYRKTDAQALTLPGDITFSVLPHTPYGQKLAQQAHHNFKDVLLHIPMESSVGKKLGPGSITSEMNETQIHAQLEKAFVEIPFAIGINNHMGSLLTQLESPMASTMRYLKKKNAMFLDSKTTRLSKAESIAQSFGVPSLHRNVFLDNQQTAAYIDGQFSQLVNIAKKHGQAIGIAHPHPETIKALTKLIPTLANNAIDLVPISALLVQQKKQYAQQM